MENTLPNMNVVMKCGCRPMTVRSRDNAPYCLTHDCDETGTAPSLTGRRARCDYFGKPVKKGMYNANCCDKCSESVRSGDGNCHCEEDSCTKLWFFVSQPDKEFDRYYCACHGAD